MMQLVEFWDGGYKENVIGVFENFDVIRDYMDANDIQLGSDNFGEDGYFIRMPDGDEIYDLD